MNKAPKTHDLGPIYSLLIEACPPSKFGEDGKLYPHEDGEKSIRVLAVLLEMTSEGIYLWIRRKRIPAVRAKQIVALTGCKKTLEDFIPHIF